eukprot:365219-Chlamydomonas_euryale.AAC.33
MPNASAHLLALYRNRFIAICSTSTCCSGGGGSGGGGSELRHSAPLPPPSASAASPAASDACCCSAAAAPCWSSSSRRPSMPSASSAPQRKYSTHSYVTGPAAPASQRPSSVRASSSACSSVSHTACSDGSGGCVLGYPGGSRRRKRSGGKYSTGSPMACVPLSVLGPAPPAPLLPPSPPRARAAMHSCRPGGGTSTCTRHSVVSSTGCGGGQSASSASGSRSEHGGRPDAPATRNASS